MNRPLLRNPLATAALVGLAAFGSACFETETTTTDGGMGMDGGGGVPAAWSAIFNTPTFQSCQDCHAPGAPGFTNGTETTQDWSTATTSFNTLKGNAAGLVGNFAGCNGVPLIGPTSSQSLLVAVFDPNVRASFSYPGFPSCTPAAITDETLRLTPSTAITPTLLADLKAFIDGGGFQ